VATRVDTRGANDVNLPYFITVMRGGNVVIAKSLGTATVHFADGQDRAEVTASGTDDQRRPTRRWTGDPRSPVKQRKAGEADAAVDPLADPACGRHCQGLLRGAGRASS
jgi:hypothetical protein